jgi:putative spermidine/putrescine transport system permease protein
MSGRWIDRIGRVGFWGLSILVALFLIGPLLIGVSMSLDARDFLGAFPPPALSLKWYESFFSNDFYVQGLKTSLLLAVISAVVSTVVGVLAAFGLRKMKNSAALTSFFMSPLLIPAVVIGFGLLIFFSRIGISNGFVRLMLGHIIVTVPYAIRTTLASLNGIKPSLHEAAMSLGATEAQGTWDVVVPLCRSGIFAGAVFAYAFSMDEVAVSLFLTDPENYTLPVVLISMMKSNFNLTIAAASTLLTMLTILIIVVLDRFVGLERFVGQGVHRQ